MEPVTREQLSEDLKVLDEKLSEQIVRESSGLRNVIENVQSELRNFKSEVSDLRVELNLRFTEQNLKFERILADWLIVTRTDIENFRIVTVQEFRKESELQRYQFRKDMEEFNEKLLKKHREEWNVDMARYMSALGEEYQWRLAAVGEKVDMTWEKCERKYVELERKDMTLADKVTLLEEYLPNHPSPRQHKGKKQPGRKKKTAE